MKKQEHRTPQHCSEDAITAYLLGMAERTDSNHVDACVDCYARVERARIQMRELRAAAEKLTSRPEDFWARQRATITDRVADARPSVGYRWLWAPGAAFAVVALVLVLFLWPPQVHRNPTMVAQDKDKDDDLLLTQIENDLQRPGPRALEPANLLVRARNDMAGSKKEHTLGGVQE